MTRARDIADLVDSNGDIVAGALDNVPAADLVNDTSPQLGGALDAQLNDMSAVGNLTLGSHSPSTAKQIRLLGDEARIEFLNSGASYNVGTSGGAAIRFHRPSAGHEGIDFETHNTGHTHQATLKISPEGYINKPLQPSFQGWFNATFGAGTSPGSRITSNIHVKENTGGMFNTSNYRWTVPVAGMYMIHLQYLKANNTTASHHVDWSINGQGANSVYRVRASEGATYDQPSGTWIFYLQANDYLEIYQHGGGGIHDYHASIIVRLMG